MKIISFILILTLVMSLGESVNAKTKYVPAKQVVKEIAQIYENYGIDYSLESMDNSVQLTRIEVDNELLKLEEALKSYVYFFDAGIADVSTNNSRFAYTKTYTTYANLSNGVLGNATIELSCSGTINDSTISFISISNISTRQYGSAFNFVSWTQTDSGYTKFDNNRKADVWAEGTLVTEANIAGQVFRQTQDYGIGMVIQAQ